MKTVLTKIILLSAIILTTGGCAFTFSPKKTPPEETINTNTNTSEEAISPEEEEFNNSGQAKAVEDETDLWPFYNNDELGISFNYPPEIILLENDTMMNDTKQSYLEVNIKDIGEQINPWDPNKEEAMNNIEALSAGEFGIASGFAFEESQQVKSVGFLFAQDYVILARFEVCSISLERKLRFYFNNKEITLTLFGPINTLMKSMPEYFKLDADNCGSTIMWDFDKQSEFYQKLNTGQAAPKIQNWYDNFDKISEEIIFAHR
jgi:hypothetical protein